MLQTTGSRSSRLRSPRLATLVVALLAASVRLFAQVPASADLFVALEPPAAQGVRSGLRERLVSVDRERLEAARVDAGRTGAAMLRLNLFDDVSVHMVVDDTGPTSSPGYWLAGRLPGREFGGVTLVVNGEVVAGTVRALGVTYAIRSVGDGVHAIRQLDPAALRPVENDSLSLASVPFEDNSFAARTSAEAGAQPIRSPARLAAPRRADAPPTEDGSRIDVMVVYTPAAQEAIGGREEVEALIDLWVAETNQAYADSGVIQRLNLVLASVVDYEEAGPEDGHGLLAGTVDLNRLRYPDDGHLDEVIDLMDRYSADIVTLVGRYADETGGVAGGYCPEETRNARRRGEEFAACANVVNHDVGGTTYAHELGHNMGLNHDRYEVTRCWRCKPPPEQDLRKYGPFPYAFGYVNQRAFEPDAPVTSRWMTIMAYRLQCSDAGFGCVEVPRFSNPDLTWNGDPMGVPGDDPSPLVTGPADARRTLNRTRRVVANFRRSPCLRDGMRIRLQASNGQYVVALGNGGGPVRADRERPSRWGRLYLVDSDGGCVESGDTVSIRTSDGFYLRAARGGGSTLDATAPRATPWARFTLHRRRPSGRRSARTIAGAVRSGDFIALQAASGHYVWAEEGGGGALRADGGGSARLWATFKTCCAR